MRVFPLSRLLLAGAAVWGGLAMAPASAGYFAINDESFSYTGTVTDPGGTAHTIPSYVSTPGSTTYPGRDTSVFLSKDAPSIETGVGNENYTQIQANWYSSLNGLNNGSGNPNNINTGYLQLFDTTNATLTSANGGWTDNSYTTFIVTLTGASTTDSNNRLWAAPEIGGADNHQAGQFITYALQLTATFDAGDVTEEFPGWFSTTVVPLSITGSFTGSFNNTGSSAPGVYDFDLTFTDINWAGANNIPDVYGSYFGASAVAAAPEPASFALLGAALTGMGFLRRRKRTA